MTTTSLSAPGQQHELPIEIDDAPDTNSEPEIVGVGMGRGSIGKGEKDDCDAWMCICYCCCVLMNELPSPFNVIAGCCLVCVCTVGVIIGALVNSVADQHCYDCWGEEISCNNPDYNINTGCYHSRRCLYTLQDRCFDEVMIWGRRESNATGPCVLIVAAASMTMPHRNLSQLRWNLF